MCGICGIWNYQSGNPVEKATIRDMTQSMVHRGPDAEGFYFDHDIGLGHRRLGIVDLEGGHQPLSNEVQTIWLVCNGEIYNHLKLRRELVAKGHRFRTKSDSEVIVHLYEEYGEESLGKLNGMFAFALWDKKEKKLLLARDRLGIKPLAYVITDGKFIFASEIKTLFEHPNVKPSLDRSLVSLYFRLSYVPSCYSIFSDVKKLLPGHYLVCKDGSVEVKQYWDVTQWDSINGDRAEISERISRQFKRSVRRRLMSDVPIGAFLSGGIDSSAIVATMREQLGGQIKTYSVSFSDSKAYDESEYACLVAKTFETDHKVIRMNGISADDLVNVVTYLDEPLADPAAIPLYKLFQLASKEVKVILNGDGGDELFGGYRRYVWDQLATSLAGMPELGKGALASVLGMMQRLPGSLGETFERGSRFVSALRLAETQRYASWLVPYGDEINNVLAKDLLAEDQSEMAIMEWYKTYFSNPKTSDRVNVLGYVDTKTYLPDGLLQKGDRMSMAHSVECRFPFLDHDLVELSARIPGHLKLAGFQTKKILRRAFRDVLPKEITSRKKRGFSVPLRYWLKGEFLLNAEEILLDASVSRWCFFDRKGMERLLRLHREGSPIYAGTVWALLVFAVWYDHFLQEQKQRVYGIVG